MYVDAIVPVARPNPYLVRPPRSLDAWLGLNDPAIYAAHKAAGGLTSVYRQIGVGSERLIRRIIGSALTLTDAQMAWSFEYAKPDNTMAVHTLDVRVEVSDLANEGQGALMRDWLDLSLRAVSPGSHPGPVDGMVVEVRQGYKSADAKRPNADLRFGVRAYQARMLPVVLVMSSQVSEQVIRRYCADGMLVLTGIDTDDALVSTFAFFDQVIRYDLRAFFSRNTDMLRREITTVANLLLTPNA